MLPFLNNKKNQIGGTITEYRKTDESSPDETGIDACSKALIKAVMSNDSKGVSEAIKAAFEILDSQPHVEGEHLNDSESLE